MKKGLQGILLGIVSALIIYMGAGVLVMPQCCVQAQEHPHWVSESMVSDSAQPENCHCATQTCGAATDCHCHAILYKEVLTQAIAKSVIPHPLCRLVATGYPVGEICRNIRRPHLPRPRIFVPFRDTSQLLALLQIMRL